MPQEGSSAAAPDAAGPFLYPLAGALAFGLLWGVCLAGFGLHLRRAGRSEVRATEDEAMEAPTTRIPTT